MSEKVTIDALVEGGKASAGPPIGPALGPTGVNLLQVVQKINELSKPFTGMKVPVKIIVDTKTKQYDIQLGIPPTSALLLRELENVQKGSGESGRGKSVGNLDFEKIIKVAKMKKDKLLSTNLKNAAKEIIGTCMSIGVMVNGKTPKEVLKDIDNGVFDAQLSKEF
jgi:large subunit ribosomal protein L11